MIKISKKQAYLMYESLREVTRLFETGDNYTTINPYGRPEVKRAMGLIAEIQGYGDDYLSARLEK